MILSVGDSLRMAMLGWQSECALRNRADLASMFAVQANMTLPSTVESCVELGRSMLRVHLSEHPAVVVVPVTDIVSGEISQVEIAADHVHTMNPDTSIEGCEGCDALKKKWREHQVTKERERRDRWAETTIAKVRHLQKINEMCGDPVDVGLLSAFVIVDAIDDVETRLERIEDRLVNIADRIEGA